jgi:phosphoribosylformylglycinamidine cyclo-ligase
MSEQLPITPTTYKDSGVNYDLMDPFKIDCQKAAISTAENIEGRFEPLGLKVQEVTFSRGESAYRVRITALRPVVFEISEVLEGIGSENRISRIAQALGDQLKVADRARQILGKSFHKGVAIDNGATVLNDLSASGAAPIAYHMFIAAGSSEWFADQARYRDLIEGNVELADLAGCSWGGGESQTLKDMIDPEDAVLAGAGVGLIFPEYVRYPSETNLRPGLSIVLLETDNPQTNGHTGLRRGNVFDRLVKRMGLPNERQNEVYTYDIGNGQTYAEAILTPSKIATPIVNELLLHPTNPVPIEYASHISGHAWRKLMRATSDFSYIIDKIPQPHPIFQLIQELSGASDKQMYEDYNMGAYYALFVEPEQVDRVKKVAEAHGQTALEAGYVEAGPKRVVIRPIDVEYKGEELQIR